MNKSFIELLKKTGTTVTALRLLLQLLWNQPEFFTELTDYGSLLNF